MIERGDFPSGPDGERAYELCRDGLHPFEALEITMGGRAGKPSWPQENARPHKSRLGFLAVLIFFAGMLAGILIQWRVEV